jgi:hypothetical protein
LLAGVGRDLDGGRARRAAAGRELTGDEARDRGVIPLRDARGGDVSPPAQGPDGAVCLLAA